MSNYTLNLDIVTMKWTDANERELYVGDNFEFPAFEDGYYQGVQYTGVAIYLQNGDWRDCGASQAGASPLVVNLPTAGSAYTKAFCVHADESFPNKFREGWFDPQLKLKNKDSTGAPRAYADADPNPCSCGS